MFEAIPQPVREKWPLYFAIETPESAERAEYEQLYFDSLSNQNRTVDLGQNQSASWVVLNPPASHKTTSAVGSLVALGHHSRFYVHNNQHIGTWSGPLHYFNYSISAEYDPRLVTVNLQPEWLYQSVKQPVACGRYGCPDNYVINYVPYYRAHMQVVPKPFSGLASLGYLIENGVDMPNLNLQTIKTVLAYISGLEAFGSEIEFTLAAFEDEQKRITAAFANDLADRERRDVNQIAQEALAVSLAVDNERKSAIRDYQGILIAAAGLTL